MVGSEKSTSGRSRKGSDDVSQTSQLIEDNDPLEDLTRTLREFIRKSDENNANITSALNGIMGLHGTQSSSFNPFPPQSSSQASMPGTSSTNPAPVNTTGKRDFMRETIKSTYSFDSYTYSPHEKDVSLQDIIATILTTCQAYRTWDIESWGTKLEGRGIRLSNGKSLKTIWDEWISNKDSIVTSDQQTIPYLIIALLLLAKQRDERLQFPSDFDNILQRKVNERFCDYEMRIHNLLRNTSYCYVNWDAFEQGINKNGTAYKHYVELRDNFIDERDTGLYNIFSDSNLLRLDEIRSSVRNTPGLRVDSYATLIQKYSNESKLLVGSHMESDSVKQMTMRQQAQILYVYVKDGHDFTAVPQSANPLGFSRSTYVQNFPAMNVSILFSHAYDLILKDLVPETLIPDTSNEHWDLSRHQKEIKKSTSEKKEKGKKTSTIQVNQVKQEKSKKPKSKPSNFSTEPMGSLLSQVKPKWDDRYSTCSYPGCPAQLKKHYTALCFRFHNEHPKNALNYVTNILQSDDSEGMLSRLAEAIPTELIDGSI